MAESVAPVETDEPTLRTLDKGLTILEELAAVGRDGATIIELARRLDIHRTTVYRFLQTLLRRGYVEPIGSTDRYRIGIKALSLASASMAGLSLRDIGAPVLEALNRQTRETVHIVVLDDGEVVTIDRLEAEHPIALRTHVGARRPAYCSAAGKAMLAFLPDAEVDAILARGMPQRAARTITDPLRLKTQLWEVRQRGFAIDDEEFVDGVRCVAAPVFDLAGRQVGAISLLAPAMRVDMAHLLRLAGPVVEAARNLSRQLGYRVNEAGWAAAGGGQ